MKKKTILILLSDPNSTTEDIILKSLKILTQKKNNYLLLGDSNLFKNLKKKTHQISSINQFKENAVNFYNINNNYRSLNEYINIITEVSIVLLKQKKAIAIINMPLNKKILKKQANGYTEFFAKKLKQSGKETMLLYSDDLAVCPLTTHLPLRKVPSFISNKKILKAIHNIFFFYKKLKKKIDIKVCGLNPHSGKDTLNCYDEDKEIIQPLVKNIKKKYKNVSGLYSADTVFFHSNNTVILGMYHDQVIGTFKLKKKFKAINITIGLKYIRISPDHGTGLDLLKNKKKISNESFKYCITFCENYLNV